MPKASGQTLEQLYIELGLDISHLQADILAADKTVTENLGRLNREKNTIKLRVEADVVALDRVKDAAKILEIQERGLNQQLSLSRDKLAILEAAYKQVASNSNSTALAVQNAEKAFLREKVVVGQLEAQLKSLSAQRITIDTSQLQEKISQLNSRIQHVRIQADIDVSKLQGANAAFDAQKVHIAAVTRELELQRQKLIQLRESMYQSAKNNGGDSVQTLNIKSNVLQQIQEISRLETKLKELQGMNINLQIRADSLRQVESQIHENIARINARIENIRVKTDIDVSKLGTMASEFDKAKAHVQGLNRELDLQNQKLAEMRKALSSSISANGLNNVKTINLQTEIQKQIQAIDQLKAKINELNRIEPPKTNSLLSGYLNIKGDVVGKLNEISMAFANLRGATSSADNAITASLNVIGAIPHPVGRAVAALASIPLVLKGVENSLLDLTRAATASGDAVYVMSRGFQMSIADTGKFTTNAKIAGVQVNDLALAVKNVQRQVARGGEDSRAAEWLRRYGESAYDASGNLKDLNSMTGSLSRALKKAQADGKGAEFVLNAFRNVSADAITAIEDWADVSDQASKIVKAGLANPKLSHEVQGNLNALNVQSAQLGTSFTNALLPVANEIIPKITERTAELTRLISDNKDLIKGFGEVIGNGFLAIEGIVDKAARGLIAFGGGLRDIYNYRKDSLVDKYKDDETVQNVEDLVGKELARSYTPQERAAIEVNPNLYNQIVASYEPIMKAIDDTRKEVEEKTKALNDTLKNAPISGAEASTIAAERKTAQFEEALNAAKEVVKLQREASDIRYKMEHSDYENRKLDLLNWQQDLLNAENVTAEQRQAIETLYAAKSAQIEQERADKIAEIRERISAADKTELERRMADIQKEKESWINAGMEKAEAEKLAQKQLTDYIKNVEKELSSNLQTIYGTELENRLAQIEKEKQAWIDKCGDEVKATQLAEQAKADAQRNAAMSALKQQAQEYEAYQKGGYGGLRAYKAARLGEQGINSDYLYMTPEQLADFQKASQVAEKSMLPNFMTDYDRAEHYQQMENWRDWQSSRYEDYDKQNYIIADGVKTGMSEVLKNTPIKFAIGKNDSEETHSITVSPDGEVYAKEDTRYSYDEKGRWTRKERQKRQDFMPTIDEPSSQYSMEDYSELNQAVQDVTASFSEIPTTTQDVVEALNGLPMVVQGISENLASSTMPQFSEAQNPFSAIEPSLANFVQTFSVMGEGVSEVTVKLSDLSAALENFSLPQANSSTTEQKAPVNVNTSVAIEEAHAWDYDHIQELAEKVADILEPRIISAIGGDSNSY